MSNSNLYTEKKAA